MQSQSKKMASIEMEMSLNIFKMLSYFPTFIHNCYSNNVKNPQISIAIEHFPFFWKI